MMNVLDLYENFGWWFEAEGLEQVSKLRKAVALADPSEQAQALEQLKPGTAYYLIGSPVAFDLIRDQFEEIRVCYEPKLVNKLVLQRNIDSWLKSDGQMNFLHNGRTETTEEYVPLRFVQPPAILFAQKA